MTRKKKETDTQSFAPDLSAEAEQIRGAQPALLEALERPYDAAMAEWTSQVIQAFGRRVRDLEAARKEQVQHFVDGKRAVDDAYGVVTKLAGGLVDAAKRRVGAYVLDRMKSAQEARERAWRLAAEGDIDGCQAALNAIDDSHGVPGLRFSFGYEIVVEDEDQLPRSLLSPDPKKLATLAKKFRENGPDAVPGCRVEETVAVALAAEKKA